MHIDSEESLVLQIDSLNEKLGRERRSDKRKDLQDALISGFLTRSRGLKLFYLIHCRRIQSK